jgi:uncharacterized protein YdeI (YjbR/CyaY-like superfamily)
MATKTLKSATKAPAGESLLVFRDQKEWASWLNEHHRTSSGIWMRIGKKGSALESLSYAEALEAALCYGWIDGQKRAYDDGSWLQRFTPRGPNSVWSRINRDKAEDLIRSGLMKPAGLDTIERAQQNGRWDSAYDSPGRAVVPSDFQTALNRSAKPRVSSQLSIGPTVTPFSGGFRPPSGPRPGPGGFRSSSGCWRGGRRSTRSGLPRCSTDPPHT